MLSYLKKKVGIGRKQRARDEAKAQSEEMVAKRLALVQDLQLALKPLLQLLMNKSKMLPTEEELFDESDIAVTRLCLAIENCFFDGLKPPQSKKSKDKPNFLGLIEYLAEMNEKAFGMTLFIVKALSNVKTKRGLCRAWIRRLLNENSLCFNLLYILKLKPEVKERWYHAWSIVRCAEQGEMLHRILMSINGIRFKIDCNRALFDGSESLVQMVTDKYLRDGIGDLGGAGTTAKRRSSSINSAGVVAEIDCVQVTAAGASEVNGIYLLQLLEEAEVATEEADSASKQPLNPYDAEPSNPYQTEPQPSDEATEQTETPPSSDPDTPPSIPTTTTTTTTTDDPTRLADDSAGAETAKDDPSPTFTNAKTGYKLFRSTWGGAAVPEGSASPFDSDDARLWFIGLGDRTLYCALDTSTTASPLPPTRGWAPTSPQVSLPAPILFLIPVKKVAGPDEGDKGRDEPTQAFSSVVVSEAVAVAGVAHADGTQRTWRRRSVPRRIEHPQPKKAVPSKDVMHEILGNANQYSSGYAESALIEAQHMDLVRGVHVMLETFHADNKRRALLHAEALAAEEEEDNKTDGVDLVVQPYCEDGDPTTLPMTDMGGGWQRMSNHGERPYYYNTVTGETRWDLPEGQQPVVSVVDMAAVEAILDMQGKMTTPSVDACQAQEERQNRAFDQFCAERQRHLELLRRERDKIRRAGGQLEVVQEMRRGPEQTEDDDAAAAPSTSQSWSERCHDRFEGFVLQRRSQRQQLQVLQERLATVTKLQTQLLDSRKLDAAPETSPQEQQQQQVSSHSESEFVFSATVVGNEMDGQAGEQVMVYRIDVESERTVRVPSALAKDALDLRTKQVQKRWSVRHRFSRFQALNTSLLTTFPGLPVPPIQIAASAKAGEDRRRCLDEYIKKLVALRQPVTACAIVMDFFAASAERERSLRERAAMRLIVHEPAKGVATLHTHSEKEMLTLQDHKCAHCGKGLKASTLKDKLQFRRANNNFRYCHYTHLFYCKRCHGGRKAMVPARVLMHWDFEPRKVCDAAAEYMRSIRTLPLLSVNIVNPDLYKDLAAMRHVQLLRLQLNKMQDYLNFCDAEEPPRAGLQDELYGRMHLAEGTDLFSLEDLQQTERGALVGVLAKVVERCAEFIVQNCQEHAQVCSICHNKDDPLFAFQILKVVQDRDSQRCYHRKCFKEDERPPKGSHRARSRGFYGDR